MKKICTAALVFTDFYLFHFRIFPGIKKADLEPIVFTGSTDAVYVYSPGLEGNLLGDTSTQPVKVYLPPGYDPYYYKRELLEKLDYLMYNVEIKPPR